MKRLAVLLGLLIAVSLGYAQEVKAEVRDMDSIVDSLKNQGAEIRYEADEPRSVRELHDWFDKKFLDLTLDEYKRGQDLRVVPLGVFRAERYYLCQDTAKWNMGVEYHLPLNTLNGSFTVYSHRFGSVEAYAKAFIGFGMTEIQDLDTKAASNFGVNGELAFNRESNWFNPLLGLSYVWVSPDSGADGQGNYLYAGNRIFITTNRSLSLDLRVGSAFWRGLDDDRPPGWFASGGLTLHRDVDVTRVGSPLLAPIEVGVFGNLSLKTISGKVMFPLRLRKGVSLAPFASYGREIGSEPYSAVYGVGAELRMFGDLIAPSLNPYIGFQQYWLADSPGAGSGSSVYFGARQYIWSDVLALDGNIGVAFWQEDTEEDRDLKDWIGRIGVTFAFGKIRDKYDVCGTVMTKRVGWDESEIAPKNYRRLDQNEVLEYNGEVRLYGLVKCDSTPAKGMRVGDLRDLKFFKIDLDFGLNLDPFSTKAGLLGSENRTNDDVFIAVLFNRNNVFVDSLTDKNTFFHFIDLDSCQYFGYAWDANSSRQPEDRDIGPLGIPIGPIDQPYMGKYDEFVKPVKWLNRETLLDFIRGGSVERKLLDMLDVQYAENYRAHTDPSDRIPVNTVNYRIGYVTYPKSTLRKLRDYMDFSDLGATVMVRAGDKDAFFSNHVKLDDIFGDDIVLDNFPYCSPELSNDQKRLLEFEVVRPLMANPQDTVVLHGYTDATPMTPDCKAIYGNDGQKGLARARAESAARYLIQRGIEAKRITAIGHGIKVAGNVSKKEDRCVIVRFSE